MRNQTDEPKAPVLGATEDSKIQTESSKEMLIYKKDIVGAFYSLSDEDKEMVMEIVANFHHRTLTHHADGSAGDVHITNRQMNDCLAWIMKHARHDWLTKQDSPE